MNQNALCEVHNGIKRKLNEIQWNVGLINVSGKYLTAEIFSNQINAAASTFRKKQKWTIECESNTDLVLIKSAQNCYLSSDRYGKVFCKLLEPDETCYFCVLTNDEGQWAFRNNKEGLYLGCQGEELHCFMRSPAWWTVQLDIHPQVNIFHTGRKRYLRAFESELRACEPLPWGIEYVFNIQFSKGKYSIQAHNGLYLNSAGKLVESCSKSESFFIQLSKGFISFKDFYGNYITAAGVNGSLSFKNSVLSKDDLFLVHPAPLQICLESASGKYVSIRQGISVSANQTEVQQTEIFQIEYVKGTNEYYHIFDCSGNLWHLETNSGAVLSSAEEKSANNAFKFEWSSERKVVLKAHNNLYLSPLATGHLRSISSEVASNDIFRFRLLNRSRVVFKCEFGYFGCKSLNGSKKIECNLNYHDSFIILPMENGSYYIKHVNSGLYWRFNPSTNAFLSTEPQEFQFHHHKGPFVLIANNSLEFIQGQQNGTVTLTGDFASATQTQF